MDNNNNNNNNENNENEDNIQFIKNNTNNENISDSPLKLIQNNKKIKHIVISGGGSFGFTTYGILKESNKCGYWNINDIKTMYGTSAGAIFITIISLNFQWDILDKFLLERPWQNVFKIDMYSIVNSIQSCGILNIKPIEDIFSPLFLAKDLTINITMKELYEVTGIELHMFTTKIDTFELIDISYKTHPDWKVTESIYASCSLPILFSPHCKDDVHYCDGGIFSNYPLYYCYMNVEDKDEIFGIKNKPNQIKIEEKESLFEYIIKLLVKMIIKLSSKNEVIEIKNEMIVDTPIVSIYDIYLSTSNFEEREKLVNKGVNDWKVYIQKK